LIFYGAALYAVTPNARTFGVFFRGEDNSVRMADHCYGCTAGHSSSCGGALDAAPAPTARATA